MTTLCGGGTSSARPGFDRILYITPFILGAALPAGLSLAEAAALGGVIGSLSFDLTQFCVSDPPAFPTITADDVFDVLNPIVLDRFIVARQKFQDLVTYYVWLLVCQCDSTTTPSPPALPTPLAGLDANPVVSPAPMAPAGCLDETRRIDVATLQFEMVGGAPSYNATPEYLSAFFANVPAYVGVNVPAYYVPSGATAWRVRATQISHVGSLGSTMAKFVGWSDASTQVTGSVIFPPRLADNASYDSGVVSLGASVAVSMQFDGLTSGQNIVWDLELTFYCGSTNPVVVQPCCPPDTSLQTALDVIRSYVELIQRQTAPFSYVLGAAHTISGSGEIAVQGLLGAKVDLTAAGTAVGVEFGDPNVLWEAGSIAWGNADGWSERRFITADPFVSFPSQAGQYTRIGYTLGQGVTATLTELRREP